MPWYRTRHTAPPLNKEITMFKDGVKTTKVFDPFDIFDGHGGFRKDVAEWWSYEKDLPDPPEAKDKGIDHIGGIDAQSFKAEPKIVAGKAPPPGPDWLGEGSLDNR